MDTRKSELSEAKRLLLQQRMRGLRSSKVEGRIEPRKPDGSVPLSAEQRYIWLHASQNPDVPIYNEPFTIVRDRNFNLDILRASLLEIIERHESWRTSFTPQGEQIVHSQVTLPLSVSDLRSLPLSEREAEAQSIGTRNARLPLPLELAPLFRAHLVRMSDQEDRIYFVVHHLIFDGISISRIFVPELITIYSAFENGRPSPLAPLPIQFGHYAVWREKHLDSQLVKNHLAYWLEQLSGELPILQLPEDRPRPAVISHIGGMELFHIPSNIISDLRRIASEHGTTLYVTLLAAYQVLLYRMSEQKDLIVGSVTDLRRRPEVEKLLGYFLGTFVVRTRPAADLSFVQYLAQTREATLAGIVAADVPFDRVVKEINPKRIANRHPIFQTFFSMRPPAPLIEEGWTLRQTDIDVGASKFDLYLELAEQSGNFEARFFYSSELWHAASIRNMAAHWIVLLRSICQNPSSTLGSLAILTNEEIQGHFDHGGWNDTSRPLPNQTLSALIEEQTRITPNAIAVTFAGCHSSYADLDARASEIASMLASLGVTRGSIVAVALHRSFDLLAGLLGVLKVGAAYLPLDIQMPRERITSSLRNAAPAAILTELSLVEELDLAGPTTISVDLARSNELFNPVENTPASAERNLNDTAYVIYTSGTTGEPKGVEVSQRNLVNLLTSMQAQPGFKQDDVLLAVTPVSFDIAMLELFLPLISGGSVVIASRDESRDPNLLKALITASGCTVMQATPSTWRSLLLSDFEVNPERSKALRVLCGGEALPRDLANRLLAMGLDLWNMYGPTETTIWSTVKRLSSEFIDSSGPVSVGYPIANTQAFILDQQLQIRPVGFPGELYIGGFGLAKGYLGHPEQTAARFINVEAANGDRLYRTGDLAVRRADGSIEVQGRTDNQVKVRGHRIELEAVEEAILRHPRVASAAARAWPEPSGEMRLAAYIVCNGDIPLEVSELRAFLTLIVPSSMVPSDFIVLPAIPLTKHGKIDRSQLPVPQTNLAAKPGPSEATSEEFLLTQIWADLLGRKTIGPTDNFFELGGHSVIVVALQQRIAKQLNQNIAVAELFQSPTIRQQAAILKRLQSGKSSLPSGVIALQPNGSRKSIFWVHYLIGNLARVIGDDQPFLSVALTSSDFALLDEKPTLQEIGACLLLKIRATQAEGPYTLGGLCVGGILAFEIASQLRAEGQEVPLVVLLDSPNPARAQGSSSGSLSTRLDYLNYLSKRAARLGILKTLHNVRVRLMMHIPQAIKSRGTKTELRRAQELIETALMKYRPQKYDGKVLLLQARERAPHVDFFPGWRAVVTGELFCSDVDGHHNDLNESVEMRSVAEAIVSHLAPATD